jgi:putative hydrolase of the HAD superfamily
MPIRAITFDLDDTLWPIGPVIQRAEEIMYRWLTSHCPALVRCHSIESLHQIRIDLNQHRPELAHDFGLLRRAVLEQAMAPLGYSAETIETAYQVFYRARNQVELYPDVKPALAELATRFPLAGLSNGNADLGRIGLDKYLKVSIHACEVGHLKPHPKMFQAAASQLELPISQILHVGDHLEHDVAGARAAGMQVVWLNRTAAQPAQDSVVTISTLAQLPEQIDWMAKD